jgi:2-polyprenyl-6-hydroxyphenyl methylase/3-demethylubiquinone-9 3-methyltransferase
VSVRSTNVDATEIERFNTLAEEWWDPHGPLRTLHEINPLRLDYIRAHARVSGQRILDVGCGGGLLSEALAAQGAEVTGIDLATQSLAVAQAHAASTGVVVSYVEADVDDHSVTHADSYDIVTCLELLEHVPHPEQLVASCARAVKPNGLVFFSTINRNAKSFALAIVAAEYLLDLVPRGTHEYAKLIRPSELGAWCRDANLEIEDIAGMQFNPLTRNHRLGGPVDVNYVCCARRARAA